MREGTVSDAFLAQAGRVPERACFVLVRAGQPDLVRTFAETARRARLAAARLRAHDVKPGDVVVLVGTHHPGLYAAWLGASLLGAVPAVLAEPSVRVDREVYSSRLEALLQRCDARIVAIDPRYRARIALDARSTMIDYDLLDADGPEPGAAEAPAVDPGAPALLQHSSGTTGLQKGVVLSHRAILRHAAAHREVLALRDDDVIASWLPLYHDMGLVACFLTGILEGVPHVWLSPFEWVSGPGALLDAVGRHRATLAWLPNFAFAFLAQRVRPDAPVDLSSLRAVVSCSEPVTAAALDAFSSAFAARGLRPSALATCYAMAETVFAMTATTPSDPPRRLCAARDAWGEGRVVRAAEGVGLVSSGRALPGCEIRIAASDGTRLPPLTQGRVLVRTPWSFDGYFRAQDARASFDAEGFFDTGDLGLLDEDGHVFVTGRAKDLLILAGKNVHPHDVEEAVSRVEGVRPGRVVAFGVPLATRETEGLCLVCESTRPSDDAALVVRAIRARVAAELDLDVVDVKVVADGLLRKSTSGKLARAGNREWYLAERFGAIPASVAR